jgi:hypothetical protein
MKNVLEVCERLVPLWFLSCLGCFAGKTRIGERCWSRWGVIECEFGVAVWLVRWCFVVVFDWCVRFYFFIFLFFWVFLAVVFVFSPVWACVGFCAVF